VKIPAPACGGPVTPARHEPCGHRSGNWPFLVVDAALIMGATHSSSGAKSGVRDTHDSIGALMRPSRFSRTCGRR
jgi:hypothetical protein